ncbi:tRNA pseudouridine38/39 synthase [Nematocida homosporus]|uniref:tRNA pseudouridine38/39 synthase n=1 Tax=Nematocida homosporus TaxID=1912981 RepID=UPI002220A1E7|nr:tRNA pseudouridine38/39 synthase [Nematocida homosporus]KAI5187465.1 tRNA pseudouridine38/39 synthase [Nematocida homosporus]
MSISQHILLKLSYNGMSYHGFAYQPGLATIEWHLFLALVKSKMVSMPFPGVYNEQNYSLSAEIISAINGADYHKCGRTDAGVSAAAQYISLVLPYKSEGDEVSVYPYDLIINRYLPANIRILGYMRVGAGFSARFSCIWREYEYYFMAGALDVDKMAAAAKELLGTHWFGRLSKSEKPLAKKRRLAKITPKPFPLAEDCVRTIDAISFETCSARRDRGDIYLMRIRARSFLHNQVRKIFGLLSLVGEGVEVDFASVLDQNRSPVHDIPLASAFPLVLSACAFQAADLSQMISRHSKSAPADKLMADALLAAEVSVRVASEALNSTITTPKTNRPNKTNKTNNNHN